MAKNQQPEPQRKRAPKPTMAETEMRVDKVARLLIMHYSAGEIYKYCQQTWGIQRRASALLVSKARAMIRESMQIEREDFLSLKITTLDKVIKEGLAAGGDRKNAISAIRLQLDATGMTAGGRRPVGI